MNFRIPVVFLAAVFFAAPAWAVPVINSFSPTYASPSSPNYVNIYGSGFTGGALQVRFGGANGTIATTAVATMDTHIQTTVPAGAQLGPQRIWVRVGNSSALSGTDFTVLGPGPYIASFTPTYGNAATLVTITGAQFNGTGNLTVWFNGVPGTVNSSSDTQILAFPPAGVTTGPVSVTRGLITYTSTGKFYVNPVITSFLPGTGRGGTNVMIRGTNFTDASAVKFNGLPAVFYVTNNNVIGAIAPPGVTAGAIRVETPHINPAESSSNFLVLPTLFGFSPDAGRPGTNVTLTGANFNVAPVTVRFGGVAAAAPTGVTFSNLTVAVPSGTTNAPITITTGHGSHTSSELFHVPAVIAGLTPTNGPSGTRVHITGANFLGTSAVTFNGIPAAGFNVTNNNNIGATVPPGVITGPITVTTPAGTTGSDPALFYGAPQIIGFSPTHGLPGTNVTVFGTNFVGVTAVRFNGLNAQFTFVDAGTITAVVPTNAATGPISVVTPAGETASASPFVLDYSSDLRVSVMAPQSVLLGNDFTYVIVLTNAGPFPAPNVVLTNLLPGSVSLKFASVTPGGSLVTSGNPVTGTFGTLAVSNSATVTLTVTPQVVTTITNITTVAGGYPDPVLTNNSSIVTTTIYAVPLISAQRNASNQLRIAWSVALSDLALQYSDDLSAITWSNVTTVPEFIGDQRVVIEPIGPGTRFYRLKAGAAP